MDNKISTGTKAELVHVLGIQYCKSSKFEKTRILDQFIAVSGYHRIQNPQTTYVQNPRMGRKIGLS